jgi:hypothetical protein
MSRIRFAGGTASSATWKCGDWGRSTLPDPKTAYVSDTEPAAAPEPVRFSFAPFNEGTASANDLYARAFQDGDASLAKLRALPDVGVNRYWLGAALQELKKNAEAEQVLRVQDRRRDLPAEYQPWVKLRLAELASERGANGDARALLEKCRAKDAGEYQYFKQRWDATWTRVHKR